MENNLAICERTKILFASLDTCLGIEPDGAVNVDIICIARWKSLFKEYTQTLNMML